MRHFKLKVCSLAAITMWTTITLAWSQESFEAVAKSATQLMPENITVTIDKFRKEFSAGISDPNELPKSSTEIIQLICKIVQQGAGDIRDKHDFASAVHKMGVISRCIANSHHPLHSSISDAGQSYRTDYDVYLENNRSFFRVRWPGIQHRPRDLSQLSESLERSISKSRLLSETLINTFKSNSKPVGQYDHQSIPFGVGSITFSNAVAQTTNAWLLLWQQAGGLNSVYR